MQTVIKDIDGNVINIGPWDYCVVDGIATNPLPQGAYEAEAEVVIGADKGRYTADNYRALRKVEYPAIGDQLDALFHAGIIPEPLASQIAAIKAKYPKP